MIRIGAMTKLTAREIAEAHPFCMAGMSEYTEKLKQSILKNGWYPWSVVLVIKKGDELHLVTASHRRQALKELLDGGKDLSGIKIPTLLLNFSQIEKFIEACDYRMLIRHIYDLGIRHDVPIETKCVGIEIRRLLNLSSLHRTILYEENLFADTFPELDRLMHVYTISCQEKVGRIVSHPWEVAMAIFWSELKGKKILECGARNSFFASFATRYTTREVHVSDYFQGWNEFGGPEVWFDLWKKAAIFPGKLICEKQDMRSLTYEDNTFDVVAGFSTVEHSPDDIQSIKEIARVTKPGGSVIISTDMALKFVPLPYCRVYSKEVLFERIINPSGLIIDAGHTLDIVKPEHTAAGYVPAMLFLTKPEA